MRTLLHLLIGALLLVLIAAGAGVTYIRSTGLRGQQAPGPMETRVARYARSFAVPDEARNRRMPPVTEEGLYLGMEHYARYCALCHANNGSGERTPLGSGLFPKPPDLRAAATQDLTDGELFWIIDNGVRFTGMPAFGTGESTPAGDKQLWELVQFVRRLPRLTEDEIGQMEALNPL